MLVQLHWQNWSDPSRTEFVAQGEFSDNAAYEAWAKELIGRRAHEIPDGWCPMVCGEGSEHFVRAAADTAPTGGPR